MADGLLSNVLGAVDRKKQEVKAGLGLLADNPQEWAAQATARYFPTKEEERQFRMVKEMGGDITQTPYYQKVFDLTQFQGSIKSPIGTASGLFRQGEFDPRFDPRKLEQERLRALTTVVNPTSSNQIPVVDLTQFAGRPFITSMSDRTAAGGKLTEIKGVKLDRPIGLLGGQDYMFYNPGQVWASGKNPVNQIMQNAQVIKEVTGQNPLYLPWRMAPSGGDFATMTGETMLSYANSALSKAEKTKVNKEIKKFIPEWSGLASNQSVEQFRNAPDSVRKALKNALDTNFRNTGGLSIGEARLAVADPRQLVAADAGIMNVGEIFAGSPIVAVSGHPSYPRGVPGQGLGRLQENRTIFELLPQVVRERGIVDPTKPSQTDIRALMMKPYAGIIDDKLLKALGY
jgi:hypothetical protein